MDRGFSSTGAPVEPGSEGSSYLLVEANGRLSFGFDQQANHSNFGSMYSFGSVACSAIQNGFDWSQLLSFVPNPGTDEHMRLRSDLLEKWSSISLFIEDEICAPGFSFEIYSQIVDVFSRLYPAYGHFEDKANFLSDNFYSFEPDWGFRSYHTAPDFRTLVAEAFGVYRKDLARAVAASSGSAIAIFSHFSGSVTSEEMTKMLLDYSAIDFGAWSSAGNNLEGVLKDIESFNRLSAGLRLRLIRNLIELLTDPQGDEFVLFSLVGDTLLMLNSISDGELKRFRSDRNWEQVHSRAVGLASAEKVSELEPLSFPQELEALDDQILLGTIGLKILRDPIDFLQAGSSAGLNNCMGSAGYYTKAKNGESYCLVGYSKEGLALGVELKRELDGDWKLLQLSGPSNRSVANRSELEGELILRLTGNAPKASRIRLQHQQIEALREVEPDELDELIARIRPLRELNGLAAEV